MKNKILKLVLQSPLRRNRPREKPVIRYDLVQNLKLKVERSHLSLKGHVHILELMPK